MSAWGKLLAEIAVPPGGWDWSWTDPGAQVVTIPEGRYPSVLDLCGELAAQIVINGAVPTITVSSVGQVQIHIRRGGVNMAAVVWANCAPDLLLALGFTGLEPVVAGLVVATNRHRWGWYPGTISRGDSDGEGLASDSGWQVSDQVGRSTAGSGRTRAIAPARRLYRRVLRWGCLRRSEALDAHRGPLALQDQWSTGTLDWYPDRDLGTVAVPGTQGDPGYPTWDADGDCDYWRVSITKCEMQALEHPQWWSCELHLDAEPA